MNNWEGREDWIHLFTCSECLLEAGRRAVRAAMMDHKRAGHPIAVWRDGQVVWIPAEEIEIPDEDEETTRP